MSPTYTIGCTSGELHQETRTRELDKSELVIDDLLGRAKISFIVQQLKLVNDLVLREPEAALPAPVISGYRGVVIHDLSLPCIDQLEKWSA